VLVSAWVLSPDGTLAVASSVDLYRLFPFTLVSLLLIFVISRLKTGRVSSIAGY
jgi:hypothetical protein